MVINNSYIGRAIESDMAWSGTSKEKMAKRIGKSVSTLNRYLSGKTTIPVTVLVDMDLLPETWERIRKGGR